MALTLLDGSQNSSPVPIIEDIGAWALLKSYDCDQSTCSWRRRLWKRAGLTLGRRTLAASRQVTAPAKQYLPGRQDEPR